MISSLRLILTRSLGWALTFPNVGWIGSLGALADALGVRWLRVVQTVCALMLVGVWTVLAVLTVVAFWRGLILKSHEESVLADTPEKDRSGTVTQVEV